MKPLKLTISAFGAYSESAVIDFTKLGDKGLYLITGDTGAGKTTIFDAICYALYGRPSGDIRSEKMLRSKYASGETKTYVELEFLCRNEKYIVRRNPEYMRPKKGKPDEMTSEKSSVSLTYPDGRTITGIKEIKASINEIVGLDEKKFKQIAMIAQGDFMNVLNASTEERTKIFREIFHTERYEKLQNSLLEIARKSRENYNLLSNSIISEIQRLECDETSEYYSTLCNLKDKNSLVVADISEIEEIIDSINLSDEKILLETNEKISKINKQLQQINIEISKAEDIEKLLNQLDDMKQRVEKGKVYREQCMSDFENKKHNNEKAQSVATEIGLLKDKLPLYEQLENLQINKNKTNNEINSEKIRLKEFENKYKQNIITLEIKEKRFEELKNCEIDCQKVENRMKELKIHSDNLYLLKKTLDKYFTVQNDFQKIQKSYISAREIFESKNNHYNFLNRSFLDAQAGILAQTLKNGERCPVCGSEHHPFPAQLADNAPTEENVNSAKFDMEKAQKNMTKLSSDAAETKAVLSQIKSQLDEKSNMLYFKILQPLELNIRIQDNIALTNKEIIEAESLYKKYTFDIEEKNKINKLLDNLKTENENLKNNINSYKQSIAVLMQNFEHQSSRIDELSNMLTYRTFDEAQKIINEKQLQIKQLEAEYEKAKILVEKCDKRLFELNGSIKSINEQLDGTERPDINALVEKKSIIDKQLEIINKEKENISLRKNSNTKAINNIKNREDALEKSRKQYSSLNSLSMTANATIGGKEKITLETYVQMKYFERVLVRANIRFRIMSNNQYEFVHSQKAESNRSKTGLEIDVVDYYNGTQRSVKSLSGGESFMASLSLALGLADEIQSQAGGIQIETMFIDEGFGSLSEQALNQSINVLSGLTEGNRLVGIISHVSELKERINKQIIVTKDKFGGSKVKIEV